MNTINFYNREKELDLLNSIAKKSTANACMTLVIGRRRIGKTTLLLKSVEKNTHLYFFVSRKNESLLCEEFIDEIKNKLNVSIFGVHKSFASLFGYLMELSVTRSFTLIIDEFQEFLLINPSIFSDMQRIWDTRKNKSKINLILCGSVYTMMKRIFEDAKEPLFGRANFRINVKPFPITVLKQIITENNPKHTPDDLLAFYMFTGGVAKYTELLSKAGAFTFDAMLNEILNENSLFLDEGKNILIEEFGKGYGTYFSILSLIASSKTSRPEIESILEKQTGGYLDKLEHEFGIIKRIKPILAKPNARAVKYYISDNFLNFWFRFIYKHKSAVEIGNLTYIKQIVKRDYYIYSGMMLERYFYEKLSLTGNYSQIGSWWNKKHKDEIDIIALNEADKKVLFVEVKRNQKEFRLTHLKEKSKILIEKLKNYAVDYKCLSMDDL